MTRPRPPAEADPTPAPGRRCGCETPPFRSAEFDARFVGVDPTLGRFGEVSIQTCKRCGTAWLHYAVEYEAFSRSGRWYRGKLSDDAAGRVTPENAVAHLEAMDEYIYGGSFFGTTGARGRGALRLDP